MLPFVDRWQDAVPAACCGTCPTCLGAAATGITTHLVAMTRFERSEDDHRAP
jgi:hypothetical protein